MLQRRQMAKIPFFNCRFPAKDRFLGVLLALCVIAPTWASDDEAAEERARLYVNDKRAPENIKDLLKIQEALQSILSQARAATVGIKLGSGSGSGVIVTADGLVLTAAHVSAGVDKDITVILDDGTKLEARTLGLNSVTDCGMARIVNEEGRFFPYVELDEEDTAQLGDWVMSLGHSGGVDQDRGSVVRLGRLVRMAPETIQSDCKLIGGDSGGPLFDLTGRLIGIHSRVGETLEQNMHVPLREFQNNWDGLLAGEFIGEGPFAKKAKPGEAFLGVGLEDWGGEGVRVTEVEKESAADKAKLQVGDVLVEMDGEKIPDMEAFLAFLEKAASGDTVEIKILRNEETEIIEAELESRY